SLADSYVSTSLCDSIALDDSADDVPRCRVAWGLMRPHEPGGWGACMDPLPPLLRSPSTSRAPPFTDCFPHHGTFNPARRRASCCTRWCNRPGRRRNLRTANQEQPGSLALGSGAAGMAVFIEGARLKSNI